MGDAGTPRVRFLRALSRGNPTLALATAHELRRLSLEDALRLVLVLRADEPERYSRAATKWTARYVIEVGGVDLRELHLLAASFAALAGPKRLVATRTLQTLFAQRGLDKLEAAISQTGGA